jgi:hypothetical protein
MKNDLEKLANEALLSKTRGLVREETRLTTFILHHLREIESRRLYASLGYSSLFDYAVHDLGYPEASAMRRIASMRLMKEIPALEGKLTRGDISLTVAAQAQSFFKQEEKAGKKLTRDEKEKVVEKLEKKTTRQAEQLLAGLSSEPKQPKPDQVKPVTAKLSEVRFTASEEPLKNLEQLKGLLAHQHPNLTIGELVSILAERALKELDPARKEARARKKPETEIKPEELVSAPEAIVGRQAIPAAVKRAVWRRDGSRCTYVCAKTGKRCNSRYQLEIDHRTPVARGGTNEIGNLRFACRNHNAWWAAQAFGHSHMRRYRRI